MRYDNDLNAEQQQAIRMTQGPLIITAGPGTGKTKTLVSKLVDWLDTQKIPAEQIVALTFTKKAGAEMQARLQALLPDQQPLPFIGTFHALAYQRLHQAGRALTVMEEADRLRLLRSLRQEAPAGIDESILRRPVRELSRLISRAKSLVPAQVDTADTISAFVAMYTQRLRERSAYDFDDLLVEFIQLLALDSPSTYQYVVVDEFQDTNRIQYEIMKQLSRHATQICVIGDPYQAIYGFRGAAPDIFTDFGRDFPTAHTITLRQNYRSAPEIVRASGSLFPALPPLVSQVANSGKVTLLKTANEYTEARWITTTIRHHLGGMDLNDTSALGTLDARQLCFKDFAVIYRVHAVSRVIRQALKESGIPYQVIGGDSGFTQPGIRFVTGCLKFIEARRDNNDDANARRSQELFEVVPRQLRFRTWQHQWETWQQRVSAPLPLTAVVETILQEFGLHDYFKATPERQESLQLCLSTMVQFDGPPDGVTQFVSYLTYLEEHDYYDTKSDKVALLTMHAAKGLEFSHVVICGFEDGLIPYTRREPVNLDEEQRLLYVAMTRAKRELYLVQAQHRHAEPTTASRWLSSFAAHIDIRADENQQRHEQRWQKIRDKKSQLRLL